jgi:hypothetical protein
MSQSSEQEPSVPLSWAERIIDALTRRVAARGDYDDVDQEIVLWVRDHHPEVFRVNAQARELLLWKAREYARRTHLLRGSGADAEGT